MAERIDGKVIAAEVLETVKAATEKLVSETGVQPGIAVVIVGEDPASEFYVRSKGKRAEECGFKSVTHRLPAETSEAELLKLIGELNADDTIHGILVQLPVPDHIDDGKVIQAISPDKDVDGFSFVNVGRLVTGQLGSAFVPCTPAGCIVLLKKAGAELSGARAVVVGRSNIVGMPAALLLVKENATVTICHSRTRDLPGVCREADVLIAAIGRAEMIRGDWIKPGAYVIDVGTNRVDDPSVERGYRLAGDVAFDEAVEVAGAITPVPGGVGPMTITGLLQNTLRSAQRAASS